MHGAMHKVARQVADVMIVPGVRRVYILPRLSSSTEMLIVESLVLFKEEKEQRRLRLQA